ncbi:putative membrane protein [Paenibacillus eucommiae]|uniref:Membrane protein n=1 Tax=Paenibacillus eucommiae TaxID=1355755 RepID=A0ABS4J5P1_9BACL|nr:putative membrane protein [Paenibacillus eucommiae]
MIYLYIIAAVMLIISLILSFLFARRQQNHEIDKSMSATTYKHRILGNPGLIAHVAFSVIGLVLIGYFMFYYLK